MNNDLMHYIKKYWIFFGSLFLGVFLWCFVYFLFPLKSVEPLKWETVLYIISGYIAIILGFVSFNFKTIQQPKKNLDVSKYITILLIIIAISFVIRWIDLFYIRELSYNIASKDNRLINDDNYSNSNLVFLVGSIIKSIYFFPIVLVLSSKVKQKRLLVLASCFVLLFPLVEALLKGTRKPFFEIFIVLFLTLIIYQRHKINLKGIIIAVFGFIVLMTISMMILINRETKISQDKESFYTKLLDSRYNDILSPKSNAIALFKNPDIPEIVKFYAMTALHTGQYLTHGVFEFNHIVDYKDLPTTYGTYTFMTIPKFINKTGFFNEIEITNPSPRQYVYLTFFGGMYIDFRWMAMPIIFLLGIMQKYVYQKVKHQIIYNPILIYFLIINVFLLVINYIRAAGIYPFFGFCFFLIVLQLLQFITYEKSPSA